MLLSQRSRAVGTPPSANDDHQMTILRHDADSLLDRRRALFVDMEPVAAGGYRLDEGRLEAIVDEGAAIQREVRALWQRAHALAAAIDIQKKIWTLDKELAHSSRLPSPKHYLKDYSCT
jgi:hypothetical protein